MVLPTHRCKKKKRLILRLIAVLKEVANDIIHCTNIKTGINMLYFKLFIFMQISLCLGITTMCLLVTAVRSKCEEDKLVSMAANPFSLSLPWFICHLFFISSPFSKWLFLMPAGHELYKKNELYIHFVSLSSCLCCGHKIQPWGQEQFQILLICYHLT